MNYLECNNILNKWDEGMAISGSEMSLLLSYLLRRKEISYRRQKILCYAYKALDLIDEDTFIERVAGAWGKEVKTDIELMSL